MATSTLAIETSQPQREAGGLYRTNILSFVEGGNNNRKEWDFWRGGLDGGWAKSSTHSFATDPRLHPSDEDTIPSVIIVRCSIPDLITKLDQIAECRRTGVTAPVSH